MKKFRKIPIEVSAIQFIPSDQDSVFKFENNGMDHSLIVKTTINGEKIVKFLSEAGEEKTCKLGDWIICSQNRNLTVCPDALFKEIYEPICTPKD